MARFPVNFPLILSALLIGLAVGDVFAIDPPREDSGGAGGAPKIPRERQLCNFNEATRMYNTTDLLLCMDELARSILLQQNVKLNRIADRAYQDTRQSYPAYPFAPDYSTQSNGGGSSNYYGNQMLSSLLSGALPLPNLSNLFDFSGLTRPNFNLFQALSSIARYDDLKCVPRILCEVASGSMPGSLSYRQSSTFQNFGSNALFGLLTAFDSSGTSPILSFGRAALLGYTNRGQSSMCYREYSRCPSNPDQLISYLNNHNGGFFRFFQGNQGNPGNYYRPQQSFNRPYYKNSVQYRILQTITEYPYSQSLLGPEADRTGTGKLTFADSDYNERESNDNRFFPEKLKQSGSSKVVFPREMRLDQAQSNRIIKSLNVFNDLNANKMKNEAYQKDRKFFPQEDEFENEYKDYFSQSQMDYNRKPRFEQHNNKQSYVNFPHDYSHHKYNYNDDNNDDYTDNGKVSLFVFPII
ncbi:uncharacterized protein LOC107982048 [Nasonia vitripennis]|uniref:Uncharacterized protein n=1 Tax=Nasonia vitripennis TaxID=7425 RepID=A0A7M7IVL9_NASVI|nr:uncharacterized protein LOC107982048 [Nasonia vitripennis]